MSRADVSGSRLRIEGSAAANRTITVDGVAMGTSDGSGRLRVERDGFQPPADCTVDVNDGSADGGVPPYRWSLAGGTLPPGLSLTTSPGRITGTPTTPGTFTCTLRVVDQAGAQASRAFTIVVSP